MKLIYRISTGLVSLMMLGSAIAYLTTAEMSAAFSHLGFPGYFRIELAIAKILGVAALWLPIPARVREWAYAGFGFTFISATLAHAASGDEVGKILAPVVAFMLLTVSYVTKQRLEASK